MNPVLHMLQIGLPDREAIPASAIQQIIVNVQAERRRFAKERQDVIRNALPKSKIEKIDKGISRQTKILNFLAGVRRARGEDTVFMRGVPLIMR